METPIMKINSRKAVKFTQIITVGIVTMSLFLPQMTFASDKLINRAGKEITRLGKSEGNNVCVKLNNGADKILNNFDRLNTKWQEQKKEHLDRVSSQRETVSERLTSIREKWEVNRSENMEKLGARAATEAQKQAVTTFKAAIDVATKNRQNALDQARTTYQKAVDDLLASRKDSIEKARVIMKTSVDTAIAKAKADCANDPTAAQTIRKTLQDSLQTAQDTFKEATKTLSDPAENLRALKQSRDEAIKKAMDDFRKEKDAAILILKAAFPNTTTTSTPSTQQ